MKPQREMRIRVYRDGRMVVMIFAPMTMGERMISSHTYTTGWRYILQLIRRTNVEWAGQTSVIRVRHQGLLEEE